MTRSQFRALEAVRDDKYSRVYHRKGNSLHGPKGVGSISLWTLLTTGYIKEIASATDICRLALTNLGREQLSITL